MAIYRRQSILTGKWHEMELPVTLGEVKRYTRRGVGIQFIFPHLTPDQREFIMSGITPDEWEKYIGPEDDEE